MERVEVAERWPLCWSGSFVLCLLKMQWCITLWMQDFVSLCCEFCEFCIWSFVAPLTKVLLIMSGQEVHATFRVVLVPMANPSRRCSCPGSTHHIEDLSRYNTFSPLQMSSDKSACCWEQVLITQLVSCAAQDLDASFPRINLVQNLCKIWLNKCTPRVSSSHSA